jgi:hypothetical protein
MSDTDKQTKEDAEVNGDWHEEYDAWVELIGDHLASIRRLLMVIAVLSGLAAAGVLILASLFLYVFLRTPPALF